jgi:hypothetical protein
MMKSGTYLAHVDSRSSSLRGLVVIDHYMIAVMHLSPPLATLYSRPHPLCSAEQYPKVYAIHIKDIDTDATLILSPQQSLAFKPQIHH